MVESINKKVETINFEPNIIHCVLKDRRQVATQLIHLLDFKKCEAFSDIGMIRFNALIDFIKEFDKVAYGSWLLQPSRTPEIFYNGFGFIKSKNYFGLDTYLFFNPLLVALITKEKVILWINEKRIYDSNTGKLVERIKLTKLEPRLINFTEENVEIYTVVDDNKTNKTIIPIHKHTQNFHNTQKINKHINDIIGTKSLSKKYLNIKYPNDPIYNFIFRIYEKFKKS
jgi:hypothetical protein